jgi:hypothetical protein
MSTPTELPTGGRTSVGVPTDSAATMASYSPPTRVHSWGPWEACIEELMQAISELGDAFQLGWLIPVSRALTPIRT